MIPDGVSAFQGTAAYYSRFRPAYPAKLIEQLARFAGLERNRDRVLDLGAGTGHVAIPIADHALEVVAVEPDDGMVNELRAAAPPTVRVLQTRVEDMPDSGTFALATAGRSMHWFASDELFARLAAITPRLALLGELPSQSQAQAAILELAREFRTSESAVARDRRPFVELLAASPFSQTETISVETERTWTVDQLIGLAYSTSFASVHRLGERRGEFEAAARERLKPVYRERVRVDAIVGTRPDAAPRPVVTCGQLAGSRDRSSATGGSGHDTKGLPAMRWPILYAVQPAQNPVAAARSASAATRRPSPAPTTVTPVAYATDAAVSTTRPILFANRGGRASSRRPSPTRGWTSSKYATHARHQRRPRIKPSASCSASRARSHHQPLSTATSETSPTTAWLNLGARSSITSASRYGSARRGRRFIS